jgi:hypothetical protein
MGIFEPWIAVFCGFSIYIIPCFVVFMHDVNVHGIWQAAHFAQGGGQIVKLSPPLDFCSKKLTSCEDISIFLSIIYSLFPFEREKKKKGVRMIFKSFLINFSIKP